MDVGFIGLGQMGSAMAGHLIAAGHRVTVFNRTREKAEPLAALGAVVADSVAAACHGEVLITMLADDAADEAVMFGPTGAMEALDGRALHISMSTISVAHAQHLAHAHAKRGRSYLSAPVMGRPEMAQAAKLFVLAGGPPAAVARAHPLLSVMGQEVLVVSDVPEHANLVKLAMNFLIAATLESFGEAFALVRKWGVEPQRFLEIATGTIFSAPLHKTYGGIIANEKYDPAGFRIELGLKDVRLALEAAETKAVPMPTASLVRDQFLAGLAAGEAGRDWSSLAHIAAVNAGL